MVVTHEPWIVALSVLVAIQGAYVGLNLALQLPDSSGGRRRLLLAGAAATLAVAIWSMHFVAMLAVRSPVRIDYLVLPTLISLLVCVMVVGLAVFLASSAPHSTPILAISAVMMGVGIVTMHFIGMFALHANAMMHHNPAYVLASFVIGVTASGLAIYFAFAGTTRPPLVAASIALGLAISGMHYTAMAGMSLHPLSGGATTEATALSRDLPRCHRRYCRVRHFVGAPAGPCTRWNTSQARKHNVAGKCCIARAGWDSRDWRSNASP